MSQKKRIISNSIASIFQKLVKVAEQLLLIPFFIQFWGVEYYGEWLTLTIIPSFLAISDFGFGTATANTFLLEYAGGKKREAANTIKTGLRVLTIVIFIILFISFLILIILKHYNLLSQSLIPKDEAFWAIFILLVARIVNFFNGVFEAYYRAARKQHISTTINSIVSILIIIGSIIVLFNGGKVIGYSLIVLLITIVCIPIYIYFAKKILNFQEYKSANYSQIQAKELFHKGLGYFLSPIWQSLYFQGTTLIIRLTLGPVAVTTFNTMRTLIRSSSQIFGFVITSIYPEFQFEIGIGNKEKVKKLFSTMLGINFIIGVLFVIFMSLFGQNIYGIWTHQKIHIDFSVWFVFISSIIFYSIWFSYSFIFEANNKPYELTVSGLVISIFSVLLVYILCLKYGIIGGAFGMLFFDILMAIILLNRSKKILKININEIFIYLNEIIIKNIYSFKKFKL